ncbi:hypothetical protein [Kordia sp.]|uniref:hypothetical protein n=1 Tax=Kordia sp. TaxID=1965332 RepID=UPI003D6A7293
MKRIQLALLLPIFSIIFLFNSCATLVTDEAKRLITEESGAIPPDLGKENTTMIFLMYHGSYNRYMKRNVRNIYKGNYIFLRKREFKNNKKYQDISKYRYVFGFEYTLLDPEGKYFFDDNPDVKKFFIYDRKTNTTYTTEFMSSSWSRLQIGYLHNLNKKIASQK